MLLIALVCLPMAGAFVTAALGRARRGGPGMRDGSFVLVTALAFVLALCLVPFGAEVHIGGFLVSGFSFRTDGFRSCYALVTAYMWLFTTIFSKEYFKHEQENLTRYEFFVLVTLGATEGVMLSADLMTAFVFFELLSFTSFTWVIHEENPGAIRAGYTYLFIAVIGGLVLFMGLLLLMNACGTLTFAELPAAVEMAQGRIPEIRAAAFCILLGFGAKAGMFPVHVWLPKAHPVAPSPASALLSGVLTKVGIYGILMTTLSALPRDAVYGEVVLIAGVITMFLGALLALFSVNLKRTLACSSMSQVGFILTGVGMYVLLGSASSEEGTMLALSGVMLHMLNHSTIKLTLFMAAGVVVMDLHTLTLDEIRGFGRKKPLFKAAFALGALGISGVPLFSGFISKTMLHESIVEGAHEASEMAAGIFPVTHGFLTAVEWIFLISGGLTFAYMLKLFICIFVEKNTDPARDAAYEAKTDASGAPYMNAASAAVIFGSSLLMAVLGQPAVMTRIAAWMTGEEEILHFRVFTWTNVKGGGISLLIGALVYLFVVRRVLMREGSYVNLWPKWLDLEDLVYRPLLTGILPGFFGRIVAVFGENRVFKPLAAAVPKAAGAAASVPGENKLLAPFAKLIMFLGTFFGRVLSMSTDALIMLLRKTVVRERRVRRAEDSGTVHTLTAMREATAEALSPLTENFSFALMMTCIGMLIILGVLTAMLLL